VPPPPPIAAFLVTFWGDATIWAASGDRKLTITATGEARPPATAVLLAACAAWCAGAPVERIGQAIPSLAAVLATGSLQPDQPRAA
jgi:UDP-N-acetylmuramyl pentapeptide synthase